MKVGYGSDHAEAAAFVRRVPAARRAQVSAGKQVLAAVGVSLFVGGAFVAYRANGGGANPRVETMSMQATSPADPEPMFAGAAFQLRVPDKGLCVDDGGGRSNGQTKFVLHYCNHQNENQIFVYDPVNEQIRSQSKNLCVDDGGGRSNGETKFHLWDCNPANENQRFVYDRNTKMFRNPRKNLCMDDGGGWNAASTQFHLWDCSSENLNQRFEVVPLPNYNVPEYMKHGQEIVIFAVDKPGLCVDDGGAYSNGQTKFSHQMCNKHNDNQIFVYDPAHYHFRSARKPNLCLDDGGSAFAGHTTFHLWECDPNNENQRFIYEEATQLIRNPTKDLCMDDGGGMRGGETQYTVQPCNAMNPNQRFAILWQSEAPEVPPPMPPMPDSNMHPLLLSGVEFMMRVPGKGELCVDDGGGVSNGQTKFHLWDCDSNNMNQVFRYDPTTMSIRSSIKANLCVDDGGGRSNGETKFHLWDCDMNNNNQKFVYDSRTMMFHNPTKGNLCMDDGGGWGAGHTQFHLWDCSEANMNQRFELLERAPPIAPPFPPGLMYPVPEILRSGEEIVIFLAEKPHACVGDGGGAMNGQTKFSDEQCNGNSPDQIFIYDPVNYHFRSARKPNMCLDDGGSAFAGHTTFHLWECDPNNENQRFIYDEGSQVIRNPTKDLCMDDGGGSAYQKAMYTVQPCDFFNPNQRYTIMRRSQVAESGMTQWEVHHPVLRSGEEFMMRVRGKDNLCVDDGGGTRSGETKFHLWSCDPNNLNQVFTYDMIAYSMRSSSKPNMCVDDGGGVNAGETKFHLWECDINNNNQKFIYEWASELIRNPTKTGLCVDDGGGMSSGETKFQLSPCDGFFTSLNQHFEIIPRSAFGIPLNPTVDPGMPFPPAVTEHPILVNGGKFLLRQMAKGDLCVDDGGGKSAGETQFTLQQCSPMNPNQQFTYDMNAMQIRSVAKPGLCMDDGGGRSNGETKFSLAPCDIATDNQKFVYDMSSLMFHSTNKRNMCMDDGGGQFAGHTQFHLWDCATTNFNQKFEVMGVGDLDIVNPDDNIVTEPPHPAPKYVVDHPLLVSGEEIMMRVPGKDNLCVDDGGGKMSGETKFHLWSCDPTNLNQVFRYDPVTFTIQSSVKANLCVDDGGGSSAGATKFHLWECDPNNMNQVFIYDWAAEQFRNPTKPNMCMDDGGGVASGQTKFHLWDCDVANGNQHFEIMRRPTVQETEAPTEPPTEEPTKEPTSRPGDNGGGIPPTEAPTDAPTEGPTEEPLQPSDIVTKQPNQETEIFEGEGDWNLLAPSHATISSVNTDNSDDISAKEIYDYLLGIRDTAEAQFRNTLTKYRRTSKCVTAGLEVLSKSSVSHEEYHALVQWMYEHCTNKPRPTTEGPNPGPVPPPVEPTYMTKLEFYYKIKGHFDHAQEQMMGDADAARLQSELALARREKILNCIEEASNRFGRYTEYEQPHHFHNAISWVQDECMRAT